MRPTRITAFLAGLLVLCLLLTPAAYAAENGIVWIRPVSDSEYNTTELLILTDARIHDGMIRIEYDAQRLTYTGLIQMDEVALYAVNAQTPGCILISWVCNSYPADGSAVPLFRLYFDGASAAENFAVSGMTHDPEGREISLGSLDTSGLEDAMKEAKKRNPQDYTDESWAVLAQSVNAGWKALEDPMVSQRELAAAARAILDAIAGLEETASRETTEAINPTEPSVPETTQPQPETTNTQKLKQAIEKAGKISGQDYTPESYAALQDALRKARDVLADADASQDTVDSAARDLEAALASLKRIPGTNAETGDSHLPGFAAALAAVSLLGIVGSSWLLRGKGWRR